MRQLFLISLLALIAATAAAQNESERRLRARELGIAPGIFAPGPLNAITDVPGVRVGHFTLIEGDDIRTGATAILPHAGNLFQERVPAAIVVGNGFGKLVGSTQVGELGQLETPILLTNTLNVWEAAAALVDHTLGQPGNEDVRSVNPVVGETNDGWLNNIRRRPLLKEHFLQALRAATSGAVEEGSVGTGAFNFKGGIGTASRSLPVVAGGYTVGVLVQTNYDGILSLDGVPVGEEWGGHPYSNLQGGSCMIVVATDAPLDARQLRRLAWRAFAGMARTGASFSNASGDYVIAFSVAESVRIRLRNRAQQLRDPLWLLSETLLADPENSPLFQAVAEATEEAIYNSLLRATTVRGYQGHETQAIPVDEVKRILKKYGRGN